MKKAAVVFLLALAGAVFAQESEFWVCPSVETAAYSLSGAAFGPGLALGYGKGAAIGVKAAYLTHAGLSTLEFSVLLRFNFLGLDSSDGPFIQFLGGPSLFIPNDVSSAFPSELGMFSAGLIFGWRFPLKGNLYFEPVIRGGYPYIAGGGLSAGVRF